MKVWKCDRCGKIYEENKNEIIKEINKPVFNYVQEDWNACYIKFFNKSLDIKTNYYNLCDDCFNELWKWFKRED